MSRSPSQSRRFLERAVSAAVAASFSSVVCAQPAGLNVIHGSATVQQQGARTTITTGNGPGTSHSALDWRSFQVPGGASVFFAQPNAGSTSINRVLGGDPSGIYGTLGSNGRLVLVNPAGIAVGAGAVVDTAGFTASTLGMTAADAAAGRLRFGSTDTAAGGALSVHGKVLARNGDVVLVAPQVDTGPGALVEATGGDVVIAAGRKVELTGRGLEGIRLEVRSPEDRVVNLGTLKGDSVGIFASQLRHSGLIQANSATLSGGKVVLQAVSQAELAGRIEASGAERGGSVLVSAERLVLKASTVIDVSHRRGGGEILVGGGWQGGDARISNASAVDVEEGVQLKADATLAGNGGSVVVWSDGITRFRGALSARGAGPAGAGGRAEVSGRRQLIFRGDVDLGADNGGTGNLLLDPDDVRIVGGAGDGSDAGLSAASLDDVLNAGSTLYSLLPADYTIRESELEGMNANISIQANRSITASGVFSGNELLLARDRDLRLELRNGGAGGIDLTGMPIRTQGTGQVELVTAGAGQHIQPDRITTAGGDIRLAAANADLRIPAALDAAGGVITLAGKRVDFSGVQDFVAGTRVNVNARDIANAGRITLRAGATLATGGADFDNQREGVIEGGGVLDLVGGKLANDGILRPGGSGAIGSIEVRGDVEMKAGSRLEIDVAGSGVQDQLLATGSLRADGTLALDKVAGYAPRATDSFVPVQAGSVSGSFKTVQAAAFAGLSQSVGGGQVTLVAAAAPAADPKDRKGDKEEKEPKDDKKGDDNKGDDKQPKGDKQARDAKDASDDKAASRPGAAAPDSTAAPDRAQDSAATPTAAATTKADTGPAAATVDGSLRSGGAKFASDGPTAAPLPIALQPAPVQAALQEPVSDTQSFLVQAAALQPLSSEGEPNRLKRRMVLTPVQCKPQ